MLVTHARDHQFGVRDHVVTIPSVEEGQYAIDLDLANDRAKRGHSSRSGGKGPGTLPGAAPMGERRWSG
jgi:hypothetical protein